MSETTKHLSDFNNHPSKCLGCESENSPEHVEGEIFRCVDCGDKCHYKYFQIGADT